MLLTTHAVAGATIGILTGNPLLGFGLAIASHHTLDALPHFDQGSFYMDADNGPHWAGAVYAEKKTFKVWRDWVVLFADGTISGIIFLILFYKLPASYWGLIVVGAFGGLLPDILDTSPLWKEKFRKTAIGRAYHKVHHFFHWPLSMKFLYLGIGIQIVITAAGLFIIKKFFM
ncbi:MAG: hypothetical protein V1661_00470 [bacterium]